MESGVAAMRKCYRPVLDYQHLAPVFSAADLSEHAVILIPGPHSNYRSRDLALCHL